MWLLYQGARSKIGIVRRAPMAIVVMLLATCVMPAATLGAPTSPGGPVIEGNSISDLNETSAVLEAKINPEGVDTEYEFWLECGTSFEFGLNCGSNPSSVLIGSGSISANVGKGQYGEDENVSVQLTGLSAGKSYQYAVVAHNSAGLSQYYVAFNTPALGSCPCKEGAMYVAGVSRWSIEANNAEGKKAVEEYEAQKAREQRTAEEAQAKERARWEALDHEAELRLQLQEQTGAEERDCIAPSLRGDTLARARLKLAKAHCQLGRVYGLRQHREGTVAIVSQSARAGTRSPPGTRVGVTVKTRTRRHR